MTTLSFFESYIFLLTYWDNCHKKTVYFCSQLLDGFGSKADTWYVVYVFEYQWFHPRRVKGYTRFV